MGLIQAAVSSVSTILADQWREYFYCDSMSDDVLVCKGVKRTGSNSSNTKGSDNVITNGSTVVVNEGQCMMIVDNGAIVEFSAQAGAFVWDSSTEPSIFYGGLGEGLKASWEAFKRRFTFGGDTGTDQRVYYFNTKEIMGNKYGTPNPLQVRVVEQSINLSRIVDVRCNGEYSYKITDPILFYKNVCGNVSANYTRSKLDAQLKSEFITALQPAFASLSTQGIPVEAILGHSLKISDAMNEALSDKWSGLRGITVVSVGVKTSIAPEDLEKIKELQDTSALRDPSMAAATLTGAQAEAMKAAAENKNGSMMGFMGMNMAQQAGGLNANALYQMGQQQKPAAPAAPAAAPAGSWKCGCGAVNTGKFCMECGGKKPEEAAGWTCSCGSVNKGKFCPECGAKKPAEAPLYACDKCGWEPEDPKNPPKFCPECGDRFDDSDIK